MKTKAICLITLALLAGFTLADGQQTATYDSLNVRVHWTFHGDGEFRGLALAPDTTLWTCYPSTTTLIEIDASNPEAIDTNFYEMDSTLGIVLGIEQDTVLIVVSSVSTIRTINIHSDPPEIIDSYTSSVARFTDRWFCKDSLLISIDNNSPRLLSFFNLSDPSNIDIFATEIDPYGYTLPKDFVIVGNTLLGITCRDLTGTEPPYSPKTYITVFDISDYSNPVLDTVYEYWNYAWDPSHRNCYTPSLIVDDTLLIVGANYIDYDVGHLVDIFNISDPSAPILTARVGDYLAEYEKRCMAYQDGYLYAGMYIYDISGFPGNDSLVGYITGQPWEIEVFGKYLAIIQATSFLILEFTEYDSTRQAISENPQPRDTWDGMFLSPNPAHRMCNVRLNSPSYGDISIYNVLGQRVAGKKVVSSKTDYSFDLSDYSPGLYLVTVRSGELRISKKMIVLE